MRDRIFRLISAALFGLTVFVAVRALRDGLDFTPDWDDLYAMGAIVLLGPTFAVYALMGERAAYKVLLPGLALLNLPSILLEAILGRFVETPDEPEDGD